MCMAESKLEKLKKEATKLGIPFDEEKVTEDELDKVVTDKKVALVEERKILKENEAKAKEAEKNKMVIIKDVFGDDVDEADYFYGKNKDTGEEGDGKAPSYFNKQCGMPVDREDLIVVFNRVFKPQYHFLFYKLRDREVYLVIVPLKHAHTIGGANESMPGDFQRHALSFIQEGSVNPESLRMKLERVLSTVKINID